MIDFSKIQILVSLGLALGLIPIVLGIVALATSEWLIVGTRTFSLLICNQNKTYPPSKDCDIAKGLEIAGVCVTALGVISAVIIGLVVKNRWIKLLPLLLLTAGPVLILIGLLLYAKAVFNVVGAPKGLVTTIGYSFILMVVTCITGFITAAYFAHVAGVDDTKSSATRVAKTRIIVAESAHF